MAGFILIIIFFLAGCQTDQAVEPSDLMMTQNDLIQQEIELTPPLGLRPQCGPHLVIEKVLMEKFKEKPLLEGGYMDNSVMQLWVGPEGSWSLSRETGSITCVIAAGFGLKMVNPPSESSI
tara:strand:- start:13 stop:375 length:363 start_codon:yes stop_codon:yes gene_type:complete